MMYDHKKAERALEKIARRKSGVSTQDVLTTAEIDLLIKRGHLYWWDYKTSDGDTDQFLALTDAGSDCMTYVRSTLRWKRKWEIMRDRADDYFQKLTDFFQELKALQAQLQPQSKLKMSIGSIEYEMEVTETEAIEN